MVDVPARVPGDGVGHGDKDVRFLFCGHPNGMEALHGFLLMNHLPSPPAEITTDIVLFLLLLLFLMV